MGGGSTKGRSEDSSQDESKQFQEISDLEDKWIRAWKPFPGKIPGTNNLSDMFDCEENCTVRHFQGLLESVGDLVRSSKKTE